MDMIEYPSDEDSPSLAATSSLINFTGADEGNTLLNERSLVIFVYSMHLPTITITHTIVF